MHEQTTKANWLPRSYHHINNGSLPTNAQMKFTNPYEDLSKEQKCRTTIDVGMADKAFISGVHGKVGTLQTTINILLKKLTDELKRNNLTSFDPDSYERAVAGCTININSGERSPVDGFIAGQVATSTKQTLGGDVRLGTSRVALAPERPSKPTDNARARKAKRGNKK